MTTLQRTMPAATPASRPSEIPASTRTHPASLRMLLRLLQRMDRGALDVTLPDRTTHRFGPGGSVAVGASAAPAVLRLRDARVAADVMSDGDVGFGEAYIDGRFDTPDLVQLLTVVAANQGALERAFYGNVIGRALLRLRHLARSNTRRQARRNILAHYDLGNDFYRLWLDPTMTYSSALFDHPGQDLAAAQQAKYDRMLALLDCAPGSRILEIGCGWGGFAETAARAGHHVTGLSLSDAQTAWARRRLADAGLAHRAEVHVRDYRDERGRYDAVASIEMIEAVGERWWPSYFRAVRDALAPGGRACIQAITIADDRFARYRTQSDFIQQHVFPGGMLPSPSRLVEEALRAGLTLVDAKTFGPDYAQTLVRWLAAFDAAHDDVRAQGFDERFVRLWRFYLAYCAAGFATRTTDVGQYTFVRA
jgi:cyclopropane-fatty-acyl-phospholipid synthase